MTQSTQIVQYLGQITSVWIGKRKQINNPPPHYGWLLVINEHMSSMCHGTGSREGRVNHGSIFEASYYRGSGRFQKHKKSETIKKSTCYNI